MRYKCSSNSHCHGTHSLPWGFANCARHVFPNIAPVRFRHWEWGGGSRVPHVTPMHSASILVFLPNVSVTWAWWLMTRMLLVFFCFQIPRLCSLHFKIQMEVGMSNSSE